MSLETQSFKFGEFLYDVGENVLYLADKAVSANPKTLRLLQILIENRGHVVEKSQLMDSLWGDSFVEEANIAFTVNLLRRTLGDNAKNPRFIETVPTRGYRFIAEVRDSSDRAANFDQGNAEIKTIPERKRLVIPIVAACVFLVGIAFVGSWYARRNAGNASVLETPFSSEKLSSDGKVTSTVISADGKNVVYVNGLANGKASIWLRQLESENSVEILPPSDNLYGAVELSPDGSLLYFARLPRNVDRQFDIYRMSILGGVPEKIVDQTQGWMSISPDGTKISFVRCYYREDENCSLWIADTAGGKNERKLISRQPPFRIGDNKIAPDGRSIAVALGQSENGSNGFSLVEVNLENGTERELIKENFYNITGLAWLPDKSGILLTAKKNVERNSRIWLAHLNSDDVEPLTKDSETYTRLSLDKEARLLVSTQVKVDFHLRILSVAEPSDERILVDATNLAFAPNGKIIFTSSMTGNDEIWSINADGGDERQLTTDIAGNRNPVVSPDSNSIYYVSNRTGETQVWRMNMDGTNPTQITQREGGFPIFASPDGKWIYYHHGKTRTLWRASTAGGDEQLVLDKARFRFAFSPDGSQVAYGEKRGDKLALLVVSLADGRTVRIFRPAKENAQLLHIAWTPDGKDLAYILVDGERQNLWFQPVDGQTPRQIADLGTAEINEQSGFSFAPDGKSYGVIQGGWKKDGVLLRGLK